MHVMTKKGFIRFNHHNKTFISKNAASSVSRESSVMFKGCQKTMNLYRGNHGFQYRNKYQWNYTIIGYFKVASYICVFVFSNHISVCYASVSLFVCALLSVRVCVHMRVCVCMLYQYLLCLCVLSVYASVFCV